jgi:hypothetical protein
MDSETCPTFQTGDVVVYDHSVWTMIKLHGPHTWVDPLDTQTCGLELVHHGDTVSSWTYQIINLRAYQLARLKHGI